MSRANPANLPNPILWIDDPDTANSSDAFLAELLTARNVLFDGLDADADEPVGEAAQAPTGEGMSLRVSDDDGPGLFMARELEALTNSTPDSSGSVSEAARPSFVGLSASASPVLASHQIGSDVIHIGSGSGAEIGKPDGVGGGPPGGGGGGGGGGGDDPVLTDTYVSGDAAVDDTAEYNVQIDFFGDGWTDQLKGYFVSAADYLSTIIYGDVEDVMLNGQWIDDIVIDAFLTDIDGQGGVLGQAGPTYIRGDTASPDELYLPLAAKMEFDVADAQYYADLGLFDSIVLHEMTHSIGFGTIWDLKGLVDTFVDDNGTRRPIDDTLEYRFNGANATQAFQTDYNPDDPLGPYVETDGGAGTAGVHWDEATFGDLLMTGYLDSTTTAMLSDMSIASLEDIGYQTRYGDDLFA